MQTATTVSVPTRGATRSRQAARGRGAFILFHALAAVYFLFGQIDLAGTVAMWLLMQVGVHAGYHRYFSHRSFRTSPWFEFVLGSAGALAFQNGPIWWASVHRRHHRTADTPEDLHSPLSGFWHSHVGWLWHAAADEIDWSAVRDLTRPGPLWIEKHQMTIHAIFIAAAAALGGSNGILAWWATPIVLCWHSTFSTNSFCHTIGTRPFTCHPQDVCMARNNFVVAVVNLGEGWHNNHHAYPSLSHHGFHKWYQLDLIYLLLLLFEKLGLVWDLRRRSCLSDRRGGPTGPDVTAEDSRRSGIRN